ncbi:MAG TPA: carbohydrate ABC transporter permease [Clostridiales bacterium]|nr:carbohydrate ABC transporter permease [Clostridiales bacterium]
MMGHNTMIQSRGEKVFQVFNYIFLAFVTLITVFPFWEVIRISFSTPAEASRMAFTLWPRETTLDGYMSVLKNPFIWMGYKNTIIRVTVGMTIQMTLMVLVAYPLSKKYFPNRNFWTLVIVFTMFFQGGLIPNYLLIKSLHLDNTLWALVLPRAIDTFAMLILRNYFMSLPVSLEEAAKIDGAGQLTTLIKVILPLSKPILVTVLLWGVVWHWNAWFDCLIYIRDGNKYVLQAILRKIVIDAAPQFTDMTVTIDNVVQPSAEIIKCATIVVSTLPIMMVYPFLQKYFIQGVIVGSLKG